MKKKVICTIICIALAIVVILGALYVIDHQRMKNNEPVVFSTWGKQYVPPENGYPLNNEGKSADSDQTETEIWALIKSVDNKIVMCEEIEYITREDTDRVNELGLKEIDMPNGYYINKSDEIKEYTLSDDTIYNIIDWHNQFVAEGEDRNYTTTKYDEFLQYLSSYHNSVPGMPFIMKIKDNQIISITEIMMP